MRLFIFLFTFLSFSYCSAQMNPMEYFYMGKHKEAIPDFAALAILERQHCPSPIIFEWNRYIGQEQICTSRYKIIRILDAVSDTLRKEYIDVKESPRHPHYKHRPMLIFGKYKNGRIQILEYEETREYFDDINCDYGCARYQEYGHFAYPDAIYPLHSIGTPYYIIKNLDSLDMIYYEQLMTYVKKRAEYAGKDFGELQRRLTQNRTSIKATKIKNDFVALGVIKNIRPYEDSKKANLYELNLTMETVIKNNAKIDSSLAIFIDRDRLPLGWSCRPLDYYLNREIAFYIFGNLQNGSLFIDSLVSPQDIFVFGDTIYDISMGLPFEELISYFFPKNISLEEFKFGDNWKSKMPLILSDEIPKSMASLPECLRNAIKEIAIKWEITIKWIDFFYNQHPEERELEQKQPFIAGINLYLEDIFRCRQPNSLYLFEYEWPGCRNSDLKNARVEVWGRKW